MSEPFYPRLCGGTFFTLITHAMKAHGRSRDAINGVSNPITEAECFKSLVRVFYPALPDLAVKTEKSHASIFKRCKNLGDGTIPFSSRFMDWGYRILKTEYSQLLRRMNDFVYKFIDVGNKGEWLVRAIIQLIQEDRSIPDDMFFQIMPDAEGVMKSELGAEQIIYIQSFLLGVWAVILREVTDNTVGEETFLDWHPSARDNANGSKHAFVSDIGRCADRPISVRLCEVKQKLKPVIDKQDLVLSKKYADYLDKARNKYETVKTILDVAPKKFYDFYVCNGLVYRKGRKYIDNPTIDTICDISNHVIIVGTGGLGKSMMMRHLMLNTIDRVDYIGKLPVFVNLKDYNDANVELSDFLFEQFCLLCPNPDKDDFLDGLAKGLYVLLMDGLDEINSGIQDHFVQMVSRLVDTCGMNVVIISSRPSGDFMRFEKFHEMQLWPLSKEKALQLVEKLDFRPEEPDLKKRFMQQLDRSLYFTHREFASNPLLLTFMLMTYERFGEVATQMHIFYSEVYDLLSKRHDAQKVGFTRAYKSGLKPDRLKDIFAAFCAFSYMDQEYHLSHAEMEMYLGRALSRSREEKERNIPIDDIIQDIVLAVCMMYEEGQQYYFMHRSFQEYFCAYCFSKQMDENFQQIGQYFEDHEPSYIDMTDLVFDMLYDMKPDQVEKYILLPHLEKLLERCNGDYWQYILLMHDNFAYELGKTPEIDWQEPKSFLLSFILCKYSLRRAIESDSLPYYFTFVNDEYVHEYNDEGDVDVVYKENMRAGCEYERDEITGDPIIVGYTLCVDVAEVLKNKDKYSELIIAMEKDDFPFSVEFRGIKKLYEELKMKYFGRENNLISVI